MPAKRKAYTPEFKQEAVGLVIETPNRSLASIAREIGVNEGTLGNWVARHKLDHAGEEPPLPISERARLRELEKENGSTVSCSRCSSARRRSGSPSKVSN